MSIFIEGYTDKVTYAVASRGTRVNGEGTVSIGWIARSGGMPDDEAHEAAVGWTLEPLGRAGQELPEYLARSESLASIQEAFNKEPERDFVVLFPSNMRETRDGPTIGSVILVSEQKYQSILDALSRAAPAIRSRYQIDCGLALLVELRDGRNEERRLAFDDWMKSGAPAYVHAEVGFTLTPIPHPEDGDDASMRPHVDAILTQVGSLRKLTLALVLLTVLSIAVQCAR